MIKGKPVFKKKVKNLSNTLAHPLYHVTQPTRTSTEFGLRTKKKKFLKLPLQGCQIEFCQNGHKNCKKTDIFTPACALRIRFKNGLI